MENTYPRHQKHEKTKVTNSQLVGGTAPVPIKKQIVKLG